MICTYIWMINFIIASLRGNSSLFLQIIISVCDILWIVISMYRKIFLRSRTESPNRNLVSHYVIELLFLLQCCLRGRLRDAFSNPTLNFVESFVEIFFYTWLILHTNGESRLKLCCVTRNLTRIHLRRLFIVIVCRDWD